MRIVIDISEYDKEWIGNAYGIPQDINTKIAEAIINAEPCQPEPHWIPVTERLPIEYDNPIEFLCTLEYKKDVRYVDLIVWNGSDWENNYTDDNKYSDYGIDKVVAWMPLPEPAKLENN